MSRSSKRTKVIFSIFTIIIILLMITAPIIQGGAGYEDIILMIESIFIFPIFEELLFRGYIWNKLENSNLKKPYVFAITTVLFGLWHLGYWDVINIKVDHNFQGANMYNIMFFKVLTGMAFGVFTGLARWKTKSTYSSILVHSFLNIFGR